MSAYDGRPEDVPTVVGLVERGALVPVMVFGGPADCPKCGEEVVWGYGLCDRFSAHAPGGSDCNRAAFFLLRPSDVAMEDPTLRAALERVLEDPREGLWALEDRRYGHVDVVDAGAP